MDRLLQSMPRDAEPIVVPNGCTDETAVIASQWGATVVEGAPEGKLPALKEGIKHLGDRALEPFITIDADSYPRFSENWLRTMRRARKDLNPHAPAVVTGTFAYNGPDPVTAAWNTAASYRYFFKNRSGNGIANGRNMLVDLHDEETLEDLLSMEHLWPGEDTAIKDLVIHRGGEWKQLISPLSLVVTSGDRALPIHQRLILGREATNARVMGSYDEEAAPGARSYGDFDDDVTRTICP